MKRKAEKSEGRRRRNPELGAMDRKERASWIDSEGAITHEIMVSQDERQLLEDYCEGARRDTVECRVIPATEKGYNAVIEPIVSVAKEISLTEPYIRTQRKKQQIQAFKTRLATPRRRLATSIIEARRILGLTPIHAQETPAYPIRRKPYPRRKPRYKQ
jgi:hypothetical protein